MVTGLILGAAVWADGPSPTLLRRTLKGAAMYHDGQVDHLILCGALGRFAPSEAEAMQDILRGQNIPDSAMTLEDQSTTTAQNIRNAIALRDVVQVHIITDWYHIPRAKLVARRAGLLATASAPSLRGAKVWPQIKMTLREAAAFAAYALRLRG